ncbi:MAG: O-antigen ligase family protein, partial [Myxococcota bacterium]
MNTSSTHVETQPLSASKRRRNTVWQATVMALWLTLPCISLQISQITLFDLVVLAVLSYISLSVFNPFRPRRNPGLLAGTPWRLKGGTFFYGTFLVLLLISALSGMNAYSLNYWLFEWVILSYLFIMCITMDLLSSQQVERFLHIGAWMFVPICLLTGVVSLLATLGIVKVNWFFHVTDFGVGSDKFRGLASTPNQWATLLSAMFPFLLMLLAKKNNFGLKVLLSVTLLLTAIMVPATGSRSGLAIMAITTVLFFGLYLLLDRTITPQRRTLIIGMVAFIAVAVWFALNSSLTESSWVFQRSLGGIGEVFDDGSIPEDDWRLLNWRWALQEFAKRPFLGRGLGNFELFYDKHEVHSTYLSLMTEAGIFAMLAYMALVGFVLWRMGLVLLASGVLRQPNLMTIALFSCISTQAT